MTFRVDDDAPEPLAEWEPEFDLGARVVVMCGVFEKLDGIISGRLHDPLGRLLIKVLIKSPSGAGSFERTFGWRDLKILIET